MYRIDDLIDRLHGDKYFSNVDLGTGHRHIQIAENDIPKTKFRMCYSLYEFLIMPFGLTNALTVFQPDMNDMFQDKLKQFIVVFLDDILIYSQTLDEHGKHVCFFLKFYETNNFMPIYQNAKIFQ